MNATDKLTMIQEALKAEKTVYIATYLRCWKITAKTFAKWTSAGIDLFKVQGDSLYMVAGRRYDCIDYCAIRIA